MAPNYRLRASFSTRNHGVAPEIGVGFAISVFRGVCFLKVGDLVGALANRDGVFEKIAGNFHKSDAYASTEVIGRSCGGGQRRQDERLRVDARRFKDAATSEEEAEGEEASRKRARR